MFKLLPWLLLCRRAEALKLPSGTAQDDSRRGADVAVGADADLLRAAVESSMSAVREDVRNLHVEVLRQAHLQQLETQRLFGQVLSGQEVLHVRMEALEKRFEALSMRRQGAPLGLF